MDFLKPPPQFNQFRNRRSSGLWVGTLPTLSSPLGIPGCVGWYDVSDGTKVTLSGSSITAITDKSSAAANLTDAGATNKWQRGVVTQNGLATATNAAAASCYMNTVAGSAGNPSSFTILIVAMSTGAVGQSKTLGGGGLSGGGAFSLYRNNGTNNFQYYENVGSSGASAAGAVPNNVWSVLEFDASSSSNNAVVRYNTDAASGSGGWPTRTFSVLNIGSGGSDTWLGSWGECVIYNTRLTTPQRNSIQTWLRGKWAI